MSHSFHQLEEEATGREQTKGLGDGIVSQSLSEKIYGRRVKEEVGWVRGSLSATLQMRRHFAIQGR